MERRHPLNRREIAMKFIDTRIRWDRQIAEAYEVSLVHGAFTADPLRYCRLDSPLIQSTAGLATVGCRLD